MDELYCWTQLEGLDRYTNFDRYVLQFRNNVFIVKIKREIRVLIE